MIYFALTMAAAFMLCAAIFFLCGAMEMHQVDRRVRLLSRARFHARLRARRGAGDFWETPRGPRHPYWRKS